MQGEAHPLQRWTQTSLTYLCQQQIFHSRSTHAADMHEKRMHTRATHPVQLQLQHCLIPSPLLLVSISHACRCLRHGHILIWAERQLARQHLVQKYTYTPQVGSWAVDFHACNMEELHCWVWKHHYSSCLTRTGGYVNGAHVHLLSEAGIHGASICIEQRFLQKHALQLKHGTSQASFTLAHNSQSQQGWRFANLSISMSFAARCIMFTVRQISYQVHATS